MNDIDLQIIFKRHREEICFDGGSWGIEFIFDTGKVKIINEEESSIREITSSEISKITAFYKMYRKSRAKFFEW